MMEGALEVAEIKEALAKARLRQKNLIEANRILGYVPCCKSCHPRPCAPPCPGSKHLAFHASRKKNRWVFGGNSSGKSVLGLTEMAIRSTFNVHPFSGLELPHPAFHRVGFESYRNFESYYLPLFKEWIPKSMLAYGNWSDAYNSKYNLLNLSNGDMMDFLSYDMDAGKWETSTLHDCWGDEKMPEEIYDAMLARLLRTNGSFWGTVTPISGMAWIIARVWGINEGETQAWTIDMDENPYLNDEAKVRIMADWSPEERQARKTGRPMQFQGMVYPEIDEHVHMVETRPEPHWPMYFCMDAHPRKEAQMLWIAVSPSGAAYCIDELAMKGTPKELSDAIFRKEYGLRQWIGAPFRGVQMRWIDLSAITLDSDIQDHYDLLSEFRKVGLAFSKANRSAVGYSVVHQYLSYDKTKSVGPFNQPMLYFVRGRVPKTWTSMSRLMYDEYRSRDRDAKEKVKDWGKDPADCVRYIVINRPKFQFLSRPVAYGPENVASCYLN